MIVEVKFFRKSAMAYVGRGYSYDTEMPLKVGDRVIVPAGELFTRVVAALHADQVIVPTIGVADGIIDQLYLQVTD